MVEKVPHWTIKEVEKIAPNGAAIRAYRIECGWSLRGLAEFIDISPSYLSKIETGKVEFISEDIKQKLLISGFTGEK